MAKPTHRSKNSPVCLQFGIVGVVCLFALIGCRATQSNNDQQAYFQDYLTQIEYPEIDEQSFQSAQQSLAKRPPSVSEYQDLEFENLTLEQAIQMALSSSKVLSRIGGQIVAAPNAALSIYDPALQETGLSGVERALSAFDANWNTTFNFNRGEQKFNNPFFGGGSSQLISNNSDFNSAITKQTANGATFGIREIINYRRNNAPINRFASSYDMIVQAEFRQSLLRGAGTLVNQVAGPNATPGVYNGVMIARLNHDQSLADFEASIRDLVREVERNYWELYYAYRNLDNLIEAKEKAREVWEKRKLREKIDRPDDEAQARQQYFSFQGQVENALAGNGPNLGVYGAERELRRLLGLTSTGKLLLRPTTDPIIAKKIYDWDNLQIGAMEKRVELRKQQWVVRQRELELLASKNLNRWQLDFIANYGWKGFGDNLAGSRSRPEGSALEDLFSGDLDDWNMGFEFGGPIGKRQTFVAVRNAELQLAKARAVLGEQQRQVVLNLNRAFVEVDRAYAGIRTNYNARVAIKDEIQPKQRRYELGAGDDDIFFFLDAQQREANTESAFVRSIVDYNLALLEIEYESGSLLSRYNIQVAEGPWSGDAYQNAAERDLRFSE